MTYKHTQIGYLMLVVTLAMLVLFTWTYITSSTELISANSGNNFVVTATMILVLFILVSFTSLRVIIDEKYFQIKFGYGIYQKKFLLQDIVSAKSVKNHWYQGWGIRFWWWPRMIIFNVSGFDAVEIVLKNNKIFRIGTDDPDGLETALKQVINKRYD